ncbi:MAG: DUF2975 domain-containing protein [Flavobacteriaceae bacterium]|nr:DUF2975 domain-containing protein [Flavobacteriaceae bacterium]
MRKLIILRAILNLFFFFLIMNAIGTLFLFILFLFSDELLIPIMIDNQQLTSINQGEIFLMISAFIGFAFFIYGVFLFKKVLNHFTRRKIFNNEIIRYFKLIGVSFIIYSFLTNLSIFIYKIAVSNKFEMVFFSGFNSFLFSTSIGLFFIVLAEIFSIAKNYKEESDLTI